MDELDERIAQAMRSRAAPTAPGDLAQRVAAQAAQRAQRQLDAWQRAERWIRPGRVLHMLVIVVAGALCLWGLHRAWMEWGFSEPAAAVADEPSGLEQPDSAQTDAADVLWASGLIVVGALTVVAIGGLMREPRRIGRRNGRRTAT